MFAVIAATGLAIAHANVENVVASRFATALESAPNKQTVASQSRALVSGSEAFWLAQKRRHDGDGAFEAAAWSAPLAAGLSVGDRITISSGKSERVLEVVAVADVEPAPGAAASAVRQIAITCRDMSTPDGRLTTLLAPAETASTASSKAARSL
jgi:hypothetical protein